MIPLPILKVQLWNVAKNVEGDVYRLPFGIRFIEWNPTGVYINGKSVYFKGFGRHEDAIVSFLREKIVSERARQQPFSFG